MGCIDRNLICSVFFVPFNVVGIFNYSLGWVSGCFWGLLTMFFIVNYSGVFRNGWYWHIAKNKYMKQTTAETKNVSYNHWQNSSLEVQWRMWCCGKHIRISKKKVEAKWMKNNTVTMKEWPDIAMSNNK